MKKAKKVVTMVSNLARPSKVNPEQNETSQQEEKSTVTTGNQQPDQTRKSTFARSMSDSGFESKDSDKLLVRRGTEIHSVRFSLSQTRRKKFRELAENKRKSTSCTRFDIPEPRFRNFTNIFGSKKTERRGSKHEKVEKVTLQSIMKTNWSNIGVDT